MKNFTSTLLTLITVISFQSMAYAATSEVTWTEPDKYTDIREGNDNRAQFRKNTFANFEKHFTKLAENLPEGQVLKVDVTNIDLAGDTHAGGINRYRIIKEIYPPRMSFSYQLVNEDGSIAKEDAVDLKDMSFMTGSRLKYRHDSIGYEKKMLDDWFFADFKDLIVEKK